MALGRLHRQASPGGSLSPLASSIQRNRQLHQLLGVFGSHSRYPPPHMDTLRAAQQAQGKDHQSETALAQKSEANIPAVAFGETAQQNMKRPCETWNILSSPCRLCWQWYQLRPTPQHPPPCSCLIGKGLVGQKWTDHRWALKCSGCWHLSWYPQE